MANKFTACMEITNTAIKLLLGYELGGKPVVVFTHYEPLEPGIIQHYGISKPDALSEALKAMQTLKIEDEKIEIKLSNVNLIVPSLGLKVYQSEKSFTVVSPDEKVGDADITNLISLLQKENVPSGYTISNIIPIAFQLDDGRRFATPPLGFVSKSVMVKAMIHTLPEPLRGQYAIAVNAVGYRVLKSNVSVYCAAKYYSTMPNVPKSYLLLDIGAGSTDLALIGDTEPYAATCFAKGGDDLTTLIAERFGISFEDAENLKVNYGYHEVNMRYKPILIKGIDENGNPKNYYQNDLNAVIKEFFGVYLTEISAGLSTFLDRYAGKDFVKTLPLIVAGGGAKLVGLLDFLKGAFEGREVLVVTPDTIGARDPSMVNLLGMLMCA
ncbi:MAG: rod shape-determining protein, partial [Bacilli bacterium]|nr:rod shape-determining protein [Bacilli bacterium]